MLIANATTLEQDGDLGELLYAQFGSAGTAIFGDFDDPTTWSVPVVGPDTAQVARGEQRRRLFENAMRKAGNLLPRTTVDLAKLMVDLGLFTRTHVGLTERWRVVDELPLPEDVLRFPTDVVEEWRQARAARMSRGA